MLGNHLDMTSSTVHSSGGHSSGQSSEFDLFSSFNSWSNIFGLPPTQEEPISSPFLSSQSSETTCASSENHTQTIHVKKGHSKYKKPSKVCQHPGGCPRYSQGGTRFCISHGGGKRCSFPGCGKSVQGSRSSLCIAHGGGKRCVVPGCEHAARGATDHCVAHGGGARCHESGCMKSAQRPSDFCIAHGGGRRCCIQGCSGILRGAGSARLCQRHASVEPTLSRMGLLTDDASVKVATHAFLA